MKFTLFLGAGASMPLRFPDTKQFKTDLENLLSQNPDKKMFSMLQRSGCEDIEDVLTAIEALVNLPSNNGYNLLKNTVRLTYADTESDSNSKPFDEIVSDFSQHKDKIQKQVYEAYSWKTNIPKENLKLYDDIFGIICNSDDGIHICTTNYDQVMENYIDNDGNGLTRVDGFVHDDATRKLIFQSNILFNPQQNNTTNTKNCYLYKLHGSLNWITHEGQIRQRETDESFADGSNFVIYPTRSSKDDDYKQEPYATMLAKFKERIEKTDVFIVIGYSFRDESINKEFQKFLRRKKTKMFVISPHAKIDTSNGLGTEEFAHISLNLTDPSQQEHIHEYDVLRTIEYDSNDVSELNELKVVLQSCLPDFCGANNKVYNLIGKLEDANALHLLPVLPLVCKISDNTSGTS